MITMINNKIQSSFIKLNNHHHHHHPISLYYLLSKKKIFSFVKKKKKTLHNNNNKVDKLKLIFIHFFLKIKLFCLFVYLVVVVVVVDAFWLFPLIFSFSSPLFFFANITTGSRTKNY